MLIDASQAVVIPVAFTDPATGELDTADALPTFRIIGDDGAVEGGNGTATLMEGGTIDAISTGATTTVTTTAAHGLATGATITIAGAAGTTGVNGTHQITVTGATTFTFNDISTSGTYTTGATWYTPGLYALTLDAPIRAALEPGRNYLCLANGVFGSDVRTVPTRFTVVS